MVARTPARTATSKGRVRAILSTFTLTALAFAGSGLPARAQTLAFTSVPAGYTAGSITLPAAFAGAVGRMADPGPGEDSIIYAAVGGFGAMKLARVDLVTGEAVVVANGPFGAIGGIAVLSPTAILITDNDAAPGGPPDETILIARDNNPADGDFDDAGEITELIAPILEGGSVGFTGAQAKIVPPGNPSGIPSGSLIFQTADGAGRSELLIVTDPLTAPAFRPVGGAYFSGFDYSGGFAFDTLGRIFMGEVEGSGFTGQVRALVNLNADDSINSPTESHLLVTGEGGMGDLAIDAQDNVFFVGYTPEFAAGVRTFHAPADALSGTIVPDTFAVTDSGFLTALLVNSGQRPFTPNTAGGATMVLSGFDINFSSALNLLTLTPYDGYGVGDFDNSGCTDINDFLYLVDNWQQDTGRGIINISDFLNLVDNWTLGAGCV